jgi:hypothetical protein
MVSHDCNVNVRMLGHSCADKGGLAVNAIDECTQLEVRLWRVAHAIHANIPRSVVRQPSVIEHRLDRPPQRPGRRELLDLALNVLTLFVPPKAGALDELEPVKCFRGYCSAFAARYHEQFVSDFGDELAAACASIPSARIRAWIEARRATNAVDLTEPFDYESFAESA